MLFCGLFRKNSGGDSRHGCPVEPGSTALACHTDHSGEIARMKRSTPSLIIVALLLAYSALPMPSIFAQQIPPATAAQTPPSTYTPKFPGDPARSDSEAAALAYMRVVIRAQKQFNKQYTHFAVTLPELVHSGSFTKRMVDPNRGDYTAGFKGKTDSYILTMSPKFMDAQHRSFYAEDDGKIHADETKPADADSPVVK